MRNRFALLLEGFVVHLGGVSCALFRLRGCASLTEIPAGKIYFCWEFWRRVDSGPGFAEMVALVSGIGDRQW